jgi:hypothetical protein
MSIKEKMAEKKKAILEATKERFGKNSLVVVDSSDEVVNDFALTYPDIDLFYIVSANDNEFSVSIRSNKKDVNIGDELKRIKEQRTDIITTAGGHSMSGGMGFKSVVPLKIVLDIIEDLNYILEEGNTPPPVFDDDIPF